MDLELINSRLGESPLVLWVRTFAGADVAELGDLVDGHLLNKIMTEIDPSFFGMSFVHASVYGDVSLRLHNLGHLLRNLKSFYQEKLQQVIVMSLPNIFAIANDPESEESIEELNKILLLILGCAVQCERKEFFIEKIMSMNESIQQELVLHIKQITEKYDKVFAFQPNEIAVLPHEELLSFCELMYDQMIKLVDQRDVGAEEVHRLLADGEYSTQEVNGNIGRMSSPSLSPTCLDMEKAKLRQVTAELEEKILINQELRDEVDSKTLKVEKLLQENKSLTETARWVHAYRDQVDVLKIQAEKANKLEGDVLKYKDKLVEMEVMRKRTEELEEQNNLLYDTKTVLEKQVETITAKADKLAETEREVVRLKKSVKALVEERAALETRHQNALEENAELLLDAQNSLHEMSKLSSELNMVKDKEDTGTSLANECNQISSTQLLRLEHENHRLKVLVAELSQYKSAAIPQKIVGEDVAENAALVKASVNAEDFTESLELNVVESLTSIKKALSSKETELTTVQKKLKENEQLANSVSESLSVKEQENSELQERIQRVVNQKRRIEELINRKNEDVAELERRLEEVIADRQKAEEKLRKKSREVTELSNSLAELMDDRERSLEGVDKKAKEVTELKERLQRLQDANKDLAETLESKREKISAQGKRICELIASAREVESEHFEMIRKKEQKLKELERKIGDLIEVESELEKLNSQIKQKDRKSDGFLKTIEQKDQEIVQLENRLEDAKSNNNKLIYNLDLKEKKLISLEERLLKADSKQESGETKEDKEKRQIQETKDNKILELESRLEDALNSSKKLEHTLKVKDERIVNLETRLEEAQMVELDRNTLVKSFEEKKIQIAELQSSLDEASGENQKLSCDLRLKENKVKDLEERIRVLEAEGKEAEKIRHVVKEKEEKVFDLNGRVKTLMEELVMLENRIEESNSQNKKLVHAIKIKEDRIASLEESVLQLEDLVNQNQKLQQMVQQKEEKIRSMEEKVDEFEESTRKCERLTQKVKNREDRIKAMNERLAELESCEDSHEKSNQLIAQKDERIKCLEQSLEDVQLKFRNLENQMAKIHTKYEEKVKRSQEDVDTHKIRRQESVRRREEQIKSLQKSRSKLETVLQAQEGHIQSLQDRLEGSVTERNKLGSSVSQKETTISQLQAKIMELEKSSTDTKKLNEVVRVKDETIQRFEDRVREVEMVLARAKSSNREKDQQIEAFEKRIEDCTDLNKKLDSKLKKKDDTLLKTERDLLKMENREKELESSLEKNRQNLEKSYARITELETSLREQQHETFSESQGPRTSTPLADDLNKIQNLKQKLWEVESRVEEIEDERGKLEHQIKRREAQIHELENQLEEYTNALEENGRLKKNIKHKEERLRILQASLEQNQQEINSLESRLESSTSEIYKLRKADDEKQQRINSFKMKMESSDGAQQIIVQKEEEVRNLEERNDELQNRMNLLNKRIITLEAELERDKKDSDETLLINSSSSHREEAGTATLHSQEDVEILNGKIEDLEKKNAKLSLEYENAARRCASLGDDNQSLIAELEELRSQHEQLLTDLTELKDSYTELDLSSAKTLDRCEMLTQIKSTLEEENKMLMEQMNKLLTQNQELLTESLVSRDHFMEEERTLADRLYELRRQKEKLEEMIDEANKRSAENTPKKKSNLFKKVLQKAGLKKKKDEPLKSKSAVQLIKYDQSPNGTEVCDGSAESSSSFPSTLLMSPERASDSSNFSEGDSPERDLSPLARRRGRINRAQRSRLVRSELFSPAFANSVAMQGRSRSLDAKEFIRDVIQAQSARAEDNSTNLVPSSSLTALRSGTTPINIDDSPQDSRRPRDVGRTRSFDLGQPGGKSNTSDCVTKKGVATTVSKLVNSSPELQRSGSKLFIPSRSTEHKNSSGVRQASDSSRRSSEISSCHSRSSSLCSGETSSDASKTTVRHIGSIPTKPADIRDSVTGDDQDKVAVPKHFIDGGRKNDGRENRDMIKLRPSSGSADSTENDNRKRNSRHQIPSPPLRMTVAAGRPCGESSSRPVLENGRGLKDKPPTKRSSSFADRPRSPSVAKRNEVIRQNSDRVFVSSLETERRDINLKATTGGSTTDRPRRRLSAGHRSSTSSTQSELATTGQSIGIVSFTEVPSVQSAVLESSPQLERKNQREQNVKRTDLSSVDKKVQKDSASTAIRGPQTPKTLRRTPKLENLSAEASPSTTKNERGMEKSALWFEYGEV